MKLLIGDPVKIPKVPICTFEVEVSQMSGDADAYNKESFKFTDQAKAEEFVELVHAICKAQSTGWCREMNEIIDEIKGSVDLSKFEYVEDLISDICGNDVTCEGYMATADGFEVFYYNNLGVKYHVHYSA